MDAHITIVGAGVVGLAIAEKSVHGFQDVSLSKSISHSVRKQAPGTAKSYMQGSITRR